MSGTDGIELASKGGEQSQRLSGEISRTGKVERVIYILGLLKIT